MTLLNLANPSETCLFSSTRISFEFRTFEDKEMMFKLE